LETDKENNKYNLKDEPPAEKKAAVPKDKGKLAPREEKNFVK